MSYAAIVSKISVRPHPNADKIALGTVAGGNQVVIGKDTPDGALGVFFPTDGQLSHEMCLQNGLYTEAACVRLSLPVHDGQQYGFFDHKRRVRSQKFRGERSDGFWVPMSFLEWTGGTDVSYLQEGMTFTELGGFPICNKYFTPATLRAMKGGTPRTRKEVLAFPKHIDTEQFRYLDFVPGDAIVYVTEKLHGTSGRYGLVRDEEPLPWYARTWNAWMGSTNLHFGTNFPLFQSHHYQYLNGSKNVILGRTAGMGYYGTDEFRETAVSKIHLAKDEVIYYELVGWVDADRPIMPSTEAPKSLPEIKKQFGDLVHYHYGCPPGTTKLFVYRITRTNEDGQQVDLSWLQVKGRCKELGLEHVPEIELLIGRSSLDLDTLKASVEAHTNGESVFPNQFREGVVVRIESSTGFRYLKNKSFAFGVMEGYLKEDEAYTDTEETA